MNTLAIGFSAARFHQIIRKSTGDYVVGAVHTNTIEGFWSIFKRGIVGGNHKAPPRSPAQTGITTNSRHAATRIDYLPLPFSSRANRGALNRCMFLMAAA
jgi:hypothetical protein